MLFCRLFEVFPKAYFTSVIKPHGGFSPKNVTLAALHHHNPAPFLGHIPNLSPSLPVIPSATHPHPFLRGTFLENRAWPKPDQFALPVLKNTVHILSTEFLIGVKHINLMGKKKTKNSQHQKNQEYTLNL